jgi:large subunit ribosomal protein L23
MIVASKPKGRFTKSGFVDGRSRVWKKAIITLKEGEIDFFSEI